MRLISVVSAVLLLLALSGCGTEPYKSSKDAPETFDDVSSGGGAGSTNGDSTNDGGDSVETQSGTILAWNETDYIFDFDDYTSTDTGLQGYWSINTSTRGWFYGCCYLTFVAHVTGVDHISQIADAAGHAYDGLVGPVNIGEIILFHNTQSDYYAAFFVDNIYGCDETFCLDATWYLQDEGTGDFTGSSDPTDTISPNSVTEFSALVADGEAMLSWTNPTNADFKGVKICRDTLAFPEDPFSCTAVYDALGTSLSDTDLTHSTTYYYAAFAYDEIPNYAAGATDSTTPIPSPWTALEPMPTARCCLAAAALGGEIYLLGGHDGNGNWYDVVEGYQPSSNSWTSKPKLLSSHAYFGATDADGLLYTILADRTLVFEPNSQQWSYRAAPPVGGNTHAVAEIEGRIYKIGGCCGSEQAVAEYDPSNDTWTSKAPLPTPRLFATAASLNGFIYVIGGEDPQGATLAVVEAYDYANDVWIEKEPMPTSRYGAAAVALNGKVYVFGGNAAGPTEKVEAYDPVTNSWDQKSLMPTPKAFLVAVELNSIIYIIGGTNGEVSASVYAYDASLDP